MKIINLMNSFSDVLVDDEDYDMLNKYNWYKHSMGYAICYNKLGDTIFLHQILGFGPIDHRDRNKLNYQKSNLFPCTASQNRMNRVTKIGKSGYRGVSWCGPMKMWRARIKVEGKEILLGYFIDKDDAAIEYNNAAIKYFGDFATQLNEVKKI